MTESISPGELRGLATFLVSIRDDWQPVPVRAALEKLSGARHRHYTAYGGRLPSSAVTVSPAEKIPWIHGSRKAE